MVDDMYIHPTFRSAKGVRRQLGAPSAVAVKRTNQTSLRQRRHQLNRLVVRADPLSTLETSVYFAGKGILLWVFFYSALNWFHYKNLRERHDKD
jgi:hypothetical protein